MAEAGSDISTCVPTPASGMGEENVSADIKVDLPKALIILSEGRSGTNFLARRLNGIGAMGNLEEWLSLRPPAKGGPTRSVRTGLPKHLKAGSADNGTFGLKVFPRHNLSFQQPYGVAFLQRLAGDYDVRYLFVERKDRIQQAISFSRALQTDKWGSSMKSKRSEGYDFNLNNRLYFDIEESYGFWRSYISAPGINTHHCYYED